MRLLPSSCLCPTPEPVREFMLYLILENFTKLYQHTPVFFKIGQQQEARYMKMKCFHAPNCLVGEAPRGNH